MIDLMQFEATDGLRLSGLLYKPRRRTDEAVIYLHGNGDSSIFTSAKRTNAFGKALTRAGIAFLPFDNRGAHRVKWMKQTKGGESVPVDGGMAFELIRDCVHDIDGALRYLRTLGYRRFHLIGHSTGANKICVYHYRKPRNQVSSYVLIAPGDDCGIYRHALGPKRIEAAIRKCRDRIRAHRGMELVPKSWSPFLISFRSFLDTVDPDGDYNVFPFREAMEGPRISKRKPLFREFRSITRPMLVIYGSLDEYAWGDVPGCLETLVRYAKRPERLSTEIIADADHGFGGKEDDLASRVARWIGSLER